MGGTDQIADGEEGRCSFECNTQTQAGRKEESRTLLSHCLICWRALLACCGCGGQTLNGLFSDTDIGMHLSMVCHTVSVPFDPPRFFLSISSTDHRNFSLSGMGLTVMFIAHKIFISLSLLSKTI